MGEVWRARDTRLNRSVAIKILPEEFAQNPRLKVRLEQEARMISQLNHPHICALYDVGDDYLAMELLEGETLQKSLDHGAIPVRKAVEYGIQIGQGLAAAHDKGVVHRDLKPANIFITREGQVKLLDFGLAKVEVPPDSVNSKESTQARLTNPGTVMGTVGYMSPEQVRGQRVDQRTDIFAMGAILYEMLAGHRAFRGQSAADTMSAILQEEPAELSRGVSPALGRIVGRCLEKNRHERFQSAHDVAFALEAVSGVTAAEPAAIRPRRAVWLIAAGLAAALAAGFFIARANSPRASKALHPRRLTHLTFEAGVEGQPSISPDGTSFAYTALTGPNNMDIYLRRVGGENVVNLTRELRGNESDPAFSPDGQQIAFRSDSSRPGGIYIMGATGEGLRRLTDFGFNPSWWPDGKVLVVATERIRDPTARFQPSQLWRIDAATGERRQIRTGGDAVQPAPSPHGARIAYWGLPKGTAKRVLYTVPADGGTPLPLTDDDFVNWNPFWSPAGDHLYFCSDRSGAMNLWRMAIDEQSGRPSGPPEPVTTAGQWNGPASISKSGAIIYATRLLSTAILRLPVDAKPHRVGDPATVLSRSRQFWRSSPSRDGRWLLLQGSDTTEDLYLTASDGSGFRRLTNDAFKERDPQWSRDSNAIYFLSNRGGPYDVWRMNRDGSGLQQVTLRSESTPEIVLGPDPARAVVFFRGTPVRHAFGIYDFKQPLPFGKPQWMPPMDANHALVGDTGSWSPDGRFLIGQVRTEREILPGIWLYSFESHQYEKILDHGSGIGWFPDSRTILFRDGDQLFVVDRIAKAVAKVFDIPNGCAGFELSSGGESMYAFRRDDEGDIWMLSPGD